MIVRALITICLLLIAQTSQAALYYISPTGSDGNAGNTASAPFKTFAYAINPSRASCGDTLILLSGDFGDGFGTGKISISGLHCSQGSELIITAFSQRQSKVYDDGGGVAARILSSSYIIIDGLHLASNDRDLALGTTCDRGRPVEITRSSSGSPGSDHITIRNNLASQQNRWCNGGMYTASYSKDLLFEDNEAYIFSRHCGAAISGENVIVRRMYCNPRGGKIPGGFSAGGRPLGSGDSIFSFYPCKNCILENSIADGTESPMYIAEMNADFKNSILMTGAKIYGNIDYKNSVGNSIVPDSRNNAGTNYSSQFDHIKDNAIIDFSSASPAINGTDAINLTVEHTTVLGTDSAGGGIINVDTAVGGTSGDMSSTFRDNLVKDAGGTAFLVQSGSTYTGNNNRSYSSAANFSPALPGNWGTTYTNDPNMGTCKVWVPATATGKGQGTGGTDIGANILYRYQSGVLTSVPLWDPVTGEFPHGATVDGINNVAGKSLFDFHLRVNVNSGGCSFPAGYGSTAPTNPSNVTKTTDLDGAHIITIPPGTKSLTVMIGVRDDSMTAAVTTAITSSCGSEDIPGQIASWSTPAGDRTMRVFGKINPTSGTCTLTPTFDNPANVDGWVMISRTDSNVDSYGDSSAASALSSTPSTTVTPGVDDIVLCYVVTSKAPTLAAGPDQILLVDISHATKVIRGALSEQAGSNGGSCTYVLGGSVGWISQTIVLAVTGGRGGTGSTFTLTKFRIDGLLGDPSTPEVTLGALGAQDASADIGIGGALRIRSNILVELAPSSQTGTSLYCKKNAGSFSRVTNSVGAHGLRMYGPGVDGNIPADGTLTTQRFSGSFNSAGGKVKRDDDAPAMLGITSTNFNLETDHLLVVASAVHGDVFACEIRRDDGATLGIHDVTPTFRAVTPTASMGF